jgi:hypothetical protein
VTTYEEWRVTGRFAHTQPSGSDQYEFTWSPVRNPHLGNPERGARDFIRLMHDVERWTDGPHLHKRTVTVTDWTEVDT